MLLLLLACAPPLVHDSRSPRPDETGGDLETGDSGAAPDTGDSVGPLDSTGGDSTADSGGETADPNPVVIEADDPALQYIGRILAGDPKAPELYWPG